MLKNLTKEEFERRTAGGKRTPVFREYIADRETPVSVLTRIIDEPKDLFLLESVYNGERKGRYSYLGLDPVEKPDERPFVAAPELSSFQGGRVGYFAYESVSDFEPRVPRRHEEGTPSEAFMTVDSFVVFDSVRDTAIVAKVAANDAPDAYERTMREIEELRGRLLSAESIAHYVEGHTSAAASREPSLSEFVPEMTEDRKSVV